MIKNMIYSGLKGRIGNNLFQIAAGYSHAIRNKTDFIAYVYESQLPEPDNCTLWEYLTQFKANIFRNVKFTNKYPTNCMVHHEPIDGTYQKINYTDNILIDGYFQSEKYFEEDAVKDLFSIDEATQKYILDKYNFLIDTEYTSINVRRGDFIKQPHLHPICSLKYYRNAINYIGKRKSFLIISDDIEWCKKKFTGNNFVFIDDEPPIIDLYLQSFCKNNIISNSSFSWWGAFLNPNPQKIVIAPANNWLGKHHAISTKDLLPESWIKISNPMNFYLSSIVLYHDIIKYLVQIKKRLKVKK